METNFKITCGVCFVNLGYDVACIDINCDTIKMLKNGVPHIYESRNEHFKDS